MEISCMGNNTLTVCPNPDCDLLISVKGEYNMDGLDEVYKQHLVGSPMCQKYLDSLPSFAEVLKEMHNHECVTGNCTCVCGCTEPTGCQLVFGVALCTSCQIDEVRGGDCHEVKANAA